MAAAASGSPATCGWRTTAGSSRWRWILAPEGRTLDASILHAACSWSRAATVRATAFICERPTAFARGSPIGRSFIAGPEWREIRLPFDRFEPYRLTEPLDVRHLRRLGLVAIGRAFHADLAVSVVGLYG